jgi:hypothetical protein
MLRITLSMVPGGDERRQYPIGNIEICNIADNGDGTSNYGVMMQRHGPFGKAHYVAQEKNLLICNEHGTVVAVCDHEDDDIKVVHVLRHHRKKREAHDLLYRALVSLGHAERNCGDAGSSTWKRDRAFDKLWQTALRSIRKVRLLWSRTALIQQLIEEEREALLIPPGRELASFRSGSSSDKSERLPKVDEAGPKFLAKIFYKDLPDDTLYVTAEFVEEARDSINMAIVELGGDVDRVEVNKALIPFIPNPIIITLENSIQLAIPVVVTKED